MTPPLGGSNPISGKALNHPNPSPQKVGVCTGGWGAMSVLGLIHPQPNHVLRRVSPFGGMTLCAVHDLASRVYIRYTASDFCANGG